MRKRDTPSLETNPLFPSHLRTSSLTNHPTRPWQQVFQLLLSFHCPCP